METQLETESSSGEDEPALVPGAHVDQYELIRELGRGGMGVVFAARDTRLGRRVAIKFVLQATGEVAQRFMIEARALAACEHPNIVVIHAVDEHAGRPYLVLELLEGHTLRDVLVQAPRLPPTRVVELVLPVARALARAHEEGIIHRDLKPENVFLTSQGQVKVLDFGIAKAAKEERDSSQRLTGKHTFLGTMTYMSPEQMGADSVDDRSDVWALGVMMFEMLAGHHPIGTSTEELITSAISDDPMPPLASVKRDVPAELARIVDSCLVKTRDQRWTSKQLVEALEAIAPGRRVRALAENESPYPGLSAFQEADAGRFFGRDAEIARMVVRVRELPLTGVVGPSGAGKSSFVRAGVGPALKASGERWEIVSLRPGRAPINALAAVIHRVTASMDAATPTHSGVRDDLVRRLRSEAGYLGSLLRAHARKIRSNVLLFVDQLEELFTLGADPAERHAFTSALSGAADDPTAPIRVVVAMRADFLDRLVDHTGFVDELSRGFMLLATPDRHGLREALEQPLALDGYAFESADIVDDMLTALEGVSGALPLLQFAAAKLWDGRDVHRRLITAEAYRAIGGISGALASHADEVMGRLDTPAQRLARKIFRALVTPERTRAIVELADLYALGSESRRVIDQLVSARLVVVQKRADADGGGTAELVHESLIERWFTLRRWLDEDQEDTVFVAQIAAAAKQWDARGRPPGLLWRGDAMDELRRWRAARPRELPARDRAFADAVIALAQRGTRRRRRAVIAGFVMLGLVAAGAIVAVIQINQARRDAQHNEENAKDMAALYKTAAEARSAAEREQALLAASQLQATANAAEAAKRQQQAEADRLAAERQAKQAENAVKAKETEVVESREQLQDKNQQLETALRDQRAATERAERATAEAQKAQQEAQRLAQEAQRTKAELQKALDKETARVKALEEAKKKLSTQLKE